MLRRIWRYPELWLGGLIVLAFAVVALAAPLIAPPQEDNPYLIPKDGFSRSPLLPNAEHPLGTLPGQYDILYGLVWGARTAFRLGLAITLGRALLGVLLGLVSGFMGGLVDALLMRLTDAFLAFPILAAVLVMLSTQPALPFDWLRGTSSRTDAIITTALVLFGWMSYARLIRGNVLAEKAKDYVQAGVAVGVPRGRLMFRHVLPNALQGLVVLVASDIGAMVALAAVLAFVGLPVGTFQGRPLADWGQMLNLARNWVIGLPGQPSAFWFTYLPTSLAIVLFAAGWNLVGDGLRDALDPRAAR
ncbi:MAG: ABC transporter permease [Chloroflexi bacterium]|nr:ABC transporter permease [Chloroflexota bacterium]